MAILHMYAQALKHHSTHEGFTGMAALRGPAVIKETTYGTHIISVSILN